MHFIINPHPIDHLIIFGKNTRFKLKLLPRYDQQRKQPNVDHQPRPKNHVTNATLRALSLSLDVKRHKACAAHSSQSENKNKKMASRGLFSLFSLE